MFWTAFQGALLLGAIGVVALVLRFRRAGAVQRQQIKWFAYGAALSIPLSLFPEARPYGPNLEFLGTVLLLAGLGIGIFRYRLWDIDRLVNRTLVYGLLTATLGTIYAGLVLVLGQLFGGIGTETPSCSRLPRTGPTASLCAPDPDRTRPGLRHDGATSSPWGPCDAAHPATVESRKQRTLGVGGGSTPPWKELRLLDSYARQPLTGLAATGDALSQRALYVRRHATRAIRSCLRAVHLAEFHLLRVMPGPG
jgi:hypothetical protein